MSINSSILKIHAFYPMILVCLVCLMWRFFILFSCILLFIGFRGKGVGVGVAVVRGWRSICLRRLSGRFLFFIFWGFGRGFGIFLELAALTIFFSNWSLSKVDSIVIQYLSSSCWCGSYCKLFNNKPTKKSSLWLFPTILLSPNVSPKAHTYG